MKDDRRAADLARRYSSLPPLKQAAFLDRHCAHDPELRAAVELLTGETEIDEAAPDPLPADATGTRIGPYELKKSIGTGGFGEVYLAEQLEPVRRQVAFKVLRSGMNTQAILRRFESERQALARMDHPNIARIYDAGETPGGRPYFAMELVAGAPINRYCDEHNLGLRQRVAIASKVCRAIQHAHQKGVIHRDLKPSNVLVTVVDGAPTPKVIDFGIAKATDEALAETALQTRQGDVLGTPAFMSPEQITGGDVDTRTDVYSLGVVLYELLTGSLPFSPQGLRHSGLGEFQRRILEEDAVRPSRRLLEAGDETTSANERATTQAELVRQCRELDWIVLKALEKDRTERYETAAELAAELDRYLAGRPVLAHPPSAGYTLRKFARRNRVLVGGVAATVLALVLGIVATATFAVREARQRAAADAARDDLQTVVDFQSQMLQRVEPAQMGNILTADFVNRYRTATANTEHAGQDGTLEAALRYVNATDLATALLDQTVLTASADALDVEYRDQPEIAAMLYRTLGQTAFRLGLYERAEQLFQQALASFATLSATHRDMLAVRRDLANVYAFMGRLDDADKELELADGDWKKLDPDDPLALDLRSAQALVLRERQDWPSAVTTYEELVRRRESLNGLENEAGVMDVDGLAWSRLMLAQFDEAERLYKTQIERTKRVHGSDSAQALTALNNLAVTYVKQGKLALAEPLYREELEKSRQLMGAEHRETHVSITNLARFYVRSHDYQRALPLAQESLTVGLQILPSDAFGLGIAHHVLGEALLGLSRPAEAERPLQEAWRIFSRYHVADHPEMHRVAGDLASVYAALGNEAETGRWQAIAAADAQ